MEEHMECKDSFMIIHLSLSLSFQSNSLRQQRSNVEMGNKGTKSLTKEQGERYQKEFGVSKAEIKKLYEKQKE